MLAHRGCGLAILALLCMQGSSFGQQAFWQTDLEAAKRQAAQSNRLVLIHFSAPWCQPCARLEENVFRKPGFSAALDPQYVGVKLNLDDHRKLASQYAVQAIPADVIITPQGQVVQKLQSPPTLENYVGIMQQVATRAGKSATLVASNSQPAAGANAMSPPPALQSPPPSMAAAAASPNAALSDNRYADYFAGLKASQAAAAPGASTPLQTPLGTPAMPAQAGLQSADSGMPGFHADPTGNMPAAGLNQSMQASAAVSRDTRPQYTTPSAAANPPASDVAAAPQSHAVQLPPGSPPLGLEGYCPVTLVDKQAWKEGDVRFGAIHHGRTYLFAGHAEQQRFLANPDAFSPVMSGDDPVLAMDENRSVPGTRKHGVFFGSRIYLFSTEATLTAFSKNPGRYAPEITQARR